MALADDDRERDGAPSASLRGLTALERDRPAVEVLAAVPWDGAELDPDTSPAGAFLAAM